MTTLTIEIEIRRTAKMELELAVEGIKTVLTTIQQEMLDNMMYMFGGVPHEFAGIEITFRIQVASGSSINFFPSIGSTAGIAVTDASGRITVRFDVDETMIQDVVFFDLEAYAFLPPTQRAVRVLEFIGSSNAVPGSAGDSLSERLLKTMQQTYRRHRIVFDAAGFERRDFFVAPMPEVDNSNTFLGVPNSVFELFDGNNRQVSVGVLRASGDPDNARSASLFVPENLKEEDCWFRVRGDWVPGYFRPGENPPSMLMRSRIRPANSEEKVPIAPAAMLIEERAGIGTIAEGIPEFGAVEDTPFVYRNLDLDLVDDGTGAFVFRVRCDVGTGWRNGDGSIFVLFTIGQFEMFFRPGLSETTNQAFTENELETAITLIAFDATFDLLPGTDLDELAPNDVEALLATTIREQVAPIIQTNIAGRIRDRGDEERQAQIEAGNPLFTEEDWEDNIDAIFQTFFVQLESITTDVNGMDIGGRAGVWHNMVDLATGNVDCPLNALSAQMPHFPILAIGRTFEKKLSSKNLSPLREIYRKHRKEVARIFMRDRKVSVASARLLVDAVNIAHGNQTGLLPTQIKQIRELISQVEKKASSDLKQSLHALDRVLVGSEAKLDLWAALERAVSVRSKKPKKKGLSKRK